LMVSKTPAIATLDSREENAAFERIDLNTRWAGFAKLQSAMVQSIGELPEGWSIGSSLLRHAVQNGVPFVPVAQSRLQQADLIRMDSDVDASTLADTILNARANSASGFVERRIFGSIGKYFAPLIWRNSSAHPLVRAAAPILALASLAFSVICWAVAAIALALIAMMFDRISDIIFGDKDNSQPAHWQKRIFWLVIIMSVLAAAWQTAAQPANAIWFSSIAVALACYSSKAALPSWSARLLKSPALLTAGLLIAGIFSTLELGAKVIVLAQLALLIAGQHLPRENTKNRIHA
jgi:hypothetical protein